MFEFDLADRVDDLICIFDSGNKDSDMDTITILLTGWITFLFFSITLVKYLYRKYKTRKNGHIEINKEEVINEKEVTNDTKSTKIANGDLESTKEKNHNEKITSKVQSSSIETSKPATPISLQVNNQKKKLVCSGSDHGVINFVTKCNDWIYDDVIRMERVSNKLYKLFIESLNKQLSQNVPTSTNEEDVFETTVENISIFEDLNLENLFAEYQDWDKIKITCDCETKLVGNISMTYPHKEKQICEFYVNRLIGRLKFLINIEESYAELHFDGWPEICLAVTHSIAKEKEAIKFTPKVSEVLSTKLSSAIRNTLIKINLFELEKFPRLPPPNIAIKKEKIKKYLKIQINRGTEIGLQRDFDTDVMCIVELDDPQQRFETSSKNLPHPIWNEKTIFKIANNDDGELLFEVYSSNGGRFLGCSIVSVNQIKDGAIEILPLKSRRLKAIENITGALEVIFTFLETYEEEQLAVSRSFRIGDESDDKNQPRFKFQGNSDGRALVMGSGSINQTNHPPPPLPPSRNPNRPKQTTKQEDQYGEERGRRRTRRGDIFTSLRRRFSKERSKSVISSNSQPPNNENGQLVDKGNSSDFMRSQSADRPIGGGRIIGLGSDSTRSSASELSQFSSQSTATFTHEASTLLIELHEDFNKNYYLIPFHLIGTGKYRKGKKLHIYNDHTFVAKRIQSGLSCIVCYGRFQFSLRKQGYQCRDCRVICHKECHVKIPIYCEKSTIYDIDVIPVT